jgi:hypothetical protein
MSSGNSISACLKILNQGLNPLRLGNYDFLTHANGGSMNYCIEIAEINDVLSFCSIFSTKSLNSSGTKYSTFVYEILQSRNIFKIPNEVLPFAIDGGGSTLFLDLTEQVNGRIVAFIHGLPGWTGRSGVDTFIEIAPSFNIYLGKLFVCEDFE